jgi:hypothetical protein
LKEKVIVVPGFISKPEDFHCSRINLMIKPGLLSLLTKKGSDKFNVASLSNVDLLNNGINRYIFPSPINFMKVDNSVMLPSK